MLAMVIIILLLLLFIIFRLMGKRPEDIQIKEKIFSHGKIKGHASFLKYQFSESFFEQFKLLEEGETFRVMDKFFSFIQSENFYEN